MKRRLLILGSPVLALALFVFVWELPRERAAQEREEREGRFLTFEAADIDTVRLRREDGGFVLARQGADAWRLLTPVQDEVAPTAVEGLLRRLASFRRERILLARAEEGDGLDAFGLESVASGATLVELVARDGTRHGLYIGRPTPSRQNTYVRRLGSTTVELAAAELSSVAGVTHQGFRPPDLIAAADSSIVWIQIQRGTEDVTLTRDARRLWHLGDDPAQWIRRSRMRTFTFVLGTAQIGRYVADHLGPEDWRAYGLEPPAADIRLRTEDGSTHRLRLGNEEQAGEVFARRGEETTLLTVDSRLLDEALAPLEELRDTNPIREVFDDLESFVIHWEDGSSLGAARRGEEWVTLLPAEFSGDLDTLEIPLRNVVLGLEQFQTTGQMIVSKTNDPLTVLDRVPVRVQLNFPGKTVGFSLGWREGEVSHWVHLDGEVKLHQVSRDLFLRLRGYLQVAEVI